MILSPVTTVSRGWVSQRLDGDRRDRSGFALHPAGDLLQAGRAGPEQSGGWQSEAFLFREEWAKPRGRKPERRHCQAGRLLSICHL